MKPTDDTIALVVFLTGRDWMYADEIAGQIARLGFERPSSQWLTSRLVAMCKESSPRFERQKIRERPWEYRVTSWAATGLENNWAGFSRALSHSRDLPRPFPKAESQTQGEGKS